MSGDLTYKTLYGSEEFGGTLGTFGIKILVSTGGREIDFHADAIQHAAYKAVSEISEEVKAAMLAVNPDTAACARLDRKNLIGLFDGAIFVESIPNGYDAGWHSRHLPWFIVTTAVGRFKIGWRKRVIHIEWTDTVGTKTAEELFPFESVTKWDKGIHAYGYVKAREYIDAVIAKATGATA